MAIPGKPRPNGPQGSARTNPKMTPTQGGRPVDKPPAKSTNDCRPVKAPGTGTRGSGTTANRVPRD